MQTISTFRSLNHSFFVKHKKRNIITRAKPTKDYVQIIQEQKSNDKKLVVQIAPAVRVAVSEGFGLKPGTITPQQLVTGLKALGFDYVFDTLWSADVTILEEGTEFLHRFVNGELEQLPMWTSCCPGWVQLAEQSFPEILPYISTTKSPMMIMGSTIKNLLPKLIDVDAKDIYSTALMPCVRKQGEADMHGGEDENRHIDVVFTTNDVIQMFKEQNIDLPNLQESSFDNPFGLGTGGAAIFGKSRGVMIAALRFAYLLLTKEQLTDIQFIPVEGLNDIVEATISLTPSIDNPFNLPNKEISFKIAVIAGLGSAKKFVDHVIHNKTEYKFVEVMACPQGCISGAGNPNVGKNKDLMIQRKEALTKIDTNATKKSSQENEDVMDLYEQYIGDANGEKAHDLYHTHYKHKPKK